MHTTWLHNFAQTVTDNISGAYVPGATLEEDIAHWSTRITLGSAVLLVVLVIIAAIIKDRWPKLKLPLFLMMVTAMAGSIIFLGASTVYLNTKADSGGPVHWHADMEIWACGNELALRDPYEFLSNKVGTATLHEHNDRRIHLEGVVVDAEKDASLGKFFHVVDGALTSNDLVVPLNSADTGDIFEPHIDGDGDSAPAPGLVEPYITDDETGRYAVFSSGQTCGDETAYVQTFVYKFDEDTKTYRQEKLADPVNYTITGNPNVPPGDCIIVEFDVLKDQTDKLCEQYGVRDIDRCEDFGVEPHQRAVCEIKQVNYPAIDPNLNQQDSTDQESINEQTRPAGQTGDPSWDDTGQDEVTLPPESGTEFNLEEDTR